MRGVLEDVALMSRYILMQCQSKRHKRKGVKYFMRINFDHLLYKCPICRKEHWIKEAIVKEKDSG